MRRIVRLVITLFRALVILVAILLAVLGAAIGVVETGWAKNQIRALIVRQANQYLTATLNIGRLEGSLFRGIELGDVTLSRNGQSLINIDDVTLSYSLRDLWPGGVVIRSIRLTRPRVFGSKQPDGRWDLGTLVKRVARDEERTGPGRPIEIQSIEIFDGIISLGNELSFGAAHLPTSFTTLSASMSLAYQPVKWTLTVKQMSWMGHDPNLRVTRLTGAFGQAAGGWFFDKLFAETPRSSFTLDGHIDKGDKPTELNLEVHADRFAFQEWSGVIHGLQNIAVEARFETALQGPLAAVDTRLRLSGTGGAVTGRLVLNTTVPGWHGAGAVDVNRLELARWLNKPDRPSDITGHVTFDLDLDLGRHFPRGTYVFHGPHAMFMDYSADEVTARGHITPTEVIVERAAAAAYGSNVTLTAGSIGIDEPFLFRFEGTARAVDLRRVPASIPVPHIESTLSFAYDVSGRFHDPYIAGRAEFDTSAFVGASIGAGTVGTIDTSAVPLRYSGDGVVDGMVLNRLGRELDIGWMKDPRYAGEVSGHFHVQGAAGDRAALTLSGGGRISRGRLFHGTLSDADVSLGIEAGTLSMSFNGSFSAVDPAVAFDDSRMAASLTGSADVKTTVRDLLTRSPSLADYDTNGTMALEHSTIRGIDVTAGHIDGSLRDETLNIEHVDVTGSTIEGSGSGSVSFVKAGVNDFRYDIAHADLARLETLTGRTIAGLLSTRGRLTGSRDNLHAVGDGMVAQLNAYGVNALTLDAQYDVAVPNASARAAARVAGTTSFLTMFGQSVQQASGTVTVEGGEHVGFDLKLQQGSGRNGTVQGSVLVDVEDRVVDIQDLAVTVGRSPWRLEPSGTRTTATWDDNGFAIDPVTFVGGATGDERIGVSGTWRPNGSGALRVTARHVFLETLQGAFERPTRYGGLLDLDAVVRGTGRAPIVTGYATITDGRVERVTYQRLEGQVTYANEIFGINVRLDQSPETWLTAVGNVPRALFDRSLPERPIDVAIKSSPINLGLLEGVTDVVRNVTGLAQIDTKVVGGSLEPHFEGSVDIANAGFLVAATGSRYKNARASLKFANDLATVESFHVEDAGGHPFDMHGSLNTHQLRADDISIDAVAQDFEVIRNEFGRMNVDAKLSFRGQFDSLRATGDMTINGGDLKVDEILAQTLYRPYATEPVTIAPGDVVSALNPWGRLGLDLTIHVPQTLKLTGSNLQISPDTPLGVGAINLRAGGDVYLYKDPGQPLYTNGSLYQMSGTYRFQGRTFQIDEANSSINFQGDATNPELYVTVTRVISAVETRVTLSGEFRQPELRFASNPPLDDTDILSLIVFNASPNDLTTAQRQELAVRAGALAAGFLAAPLMSAIEREIGLDVLELEPGGEFGTGPRVTLGDEIAPGLIARFSRDFGPEPYDEATIEYYLSRILRLRATLSDAQSLNARAPFRRVERAGIDLLLFFSF